MNRLYTQKSLPAAIVVLALANALTFCVNPPDYPDEPVIEYRRMSTNTLRQSAIVPEPNEETTTVVIGFTDGDGDLGFNDSTSLITVTDQRVLIPHPTPYILPEIDHLGAGNGISGEILLTIPTTCCIPPPTSSGQQLPPCEPDVTPNMLRDTVVFTIQLRDRAGHLSNVIETEPIVLICRE